MSAKQADSTQEVQVDTQIVDDGMQGAIVNTSGHIHGLGETIAGGVLNKDIKPRDVPIEDMPAPYDEVVRGVSEGRDATDLMGQVGVSVITSCQNAWIKADAKNPKELTDALRKAAACHRWAIKADPLVDKARRGQSPNLEDIKNHKTRTDNLERQLQVDRGKRFTLWSVEDIFAVEDTTRWIVPGYLPAGLTLLAGPSKFGKSVLSLQLARAVAEGGEFFGQKAEQCPVLGIFLEDPPKRLKVRMTMQGWEKDNRADTMTRSDFLQEIGTLKGGGLDKLTELIDTGSYGLVIIDTLGMAIADQSDYKEYGEMICQLSGLQTLAGERDISIVVVHHHNKQGEALGSVALMATPDTLWDVWAKGDVETAPRYSVRMKGRDLMDDVYMDLFRKRETLTWEVEVATSAQAIVSDKDRELLKAINQLGPNAYAARIAEQVGRGRANIADPLGRLVRDGWCRKDGRVYVPLVTME